MKKGKLIILSAPSGAGKTSICRKLLENNKKWKFSVSATTREKRDNEVDGEDYIFMKKDQFEHLDKFGEFIESEWVHGNRYGTLYAPLEEAIDNGDLILLDIDVKGAMNIIEEFPDDMISIFIEPPGFDNQEKLDNLRERIVQRGNSNETLIKQRLRRYELELSYKEKFDFSFVNENLEKTSNKIEKTIKEKI
tara:strand:- start:186 stop:764 length:579 start_codon:yes stop_codon:yes gene_type:complete